MASPSFGLPPSFVGEHPFSEVFPRHLLPGARGVNKRVTELSRPRLSPEDQAALKIALESAGRPHGTLQLPSLWRIR